LKVSGGVASDIIPVEEIAMAKPRRKVIIVSTDGEDVVRSGKGHDGR
jgi:hypothetical protein